jgi:hypothetical protein
MLKMMYSSCCQQRPLGALFISHLKLIEVFLPFEQQEHKGLIEGNGTK